MSPAPPKAKIFVDGNCVICDLEIAHYKSQAPDKFELVDISQNSFVAAQFGLSTAAVNKNLHILTPKGELKVGVDAFVYIWNQIPKYHWAARLVATAPVQPLAKIAYQAFTVVRPFLPKKKRGA